MKRNIIYPLLLALTLTGCGSAVQSPASVPEPSETAAETTAAPAAETAAETTAHETEPETTEPTPPVTVPEETEETTEPLGQFAPATDVEKAAYRFIREELVPVYGLSDTAFYETVNWDEGVAAEPPESTQGIISALIYDITGDSTPELLVFRSHGLTFLMEGYTPNGDSFDEIGSAVIVESDETLDSIPSVTVAGDRILVRETFAALPGLSRYGTHFSVYGVTGGSLQKLTEVTGYRAPGTVSISVNDDVHSADEIGDNLDYDALSEEIRQNLEIEGVSCESVTCGWGEEFGIGYGAAITVPDEMPVWNLEYVQDSGSFFLDETGLRERLNFE